MRKDAKTPVYEGCSVTKLEAELLLLKMKSSNDLYDLLSVVQKLRTERISSLNT